MEIRLKNKRFNPVRAAACGLTELEDEYRYLADIADGTLLLTIDITTDGLIHTCVTDNVSGDEYVLHLMDEAVGSFVGKVREDYDAALAYITENCFEDEVFNARLTKRVIEYAFERYGDKPEFLWEKFPDNAVLRRADNAKWYAAILTVSRRKLGLDSDEIAEIIDLRMEPEELNQRVDNQLYFRGWHMNKKHWMTVVLDGSVPFDEVCRLLNNSYVLAK